LDPNHLPQGKGGRSSKTRYGADKGKYDKGKYTFDTSLREYLSWLYARAGVLKSGASRDFKVVLRGKVSGLQV
jgi:hypothetical protein